MAQDKDESVNPEQEILFLFRHRRGSPYFFKRFFAQTALFGSLILARFAYKYLVVLEYSEHLKTTILYKKKRVSSP